ncbi:GNAT family N-acetyltransferase [Thalassococcus sp. S3]|uniref:GNAT family N-acetyltransferase n=1 Tax=Thalassococcus sp. S3 TaxID=2017482 RepID=UPI0020C316B2|nr:GNAT family N-acetyltransferase [Thalassococcus sp. S3]
MTVRRLTIQDHANILNLYAELAPATPVLQNVSGLEALIAHPGTELLGAEVEGSVGAMVTLHVLPNLTYGGRPYALIENVVTAQRFQMRGLGRRVMEAAIRSAWAQDAYKIMLLTGQTAGARGFYERLGFSADEKFGMTLRRVPTRGAQAIKTTGPAP